MTLILARAAGESRLVTVLAGAFAGLAGFIMFGAAHALIIEPIWTRMLGGILFAVAAGIALAFVVRVIDPAVRSYAAGVGAGALAWLLVVPSTAVGAWLRVSGVREQLPSIEVPLVLATAGVAGGVAGGAIGRRFGPAITVAIAAMVLVVAMAGPVPVTNGRRPTMLFLSFLPMFIAGGTCVVLARRLIATRLVR